jgi:hypothetical protein
MIDEMIPNIEPSATDVMRETAKDAKNAFSPLIGTVKFGYHYIRTVILCATAPATIPTAIRRAKESDYWSKIDLENGDMENLPRYLGGMLGFVTTIASYIALPISTAIGHKLADAARSGLSLEHLTISDMALIGTGLVATNILSAGYESLRNLASTYAHNRATLKERQQGEYRAQLEEILAPQALERLEQTLGETSYSGQETPE